MATDHNRTDHSGAGPSGATSPGAGRGPRPRWPGAGRSVATTLAATAGAAVLAVAVLSGGAGAPAGSATKQAPVLSAQALQQTFVNVVRTMRPSVVEISTDQGLGSGVVYDDKGDIVTNNHVVAGATSFTVSAASGRQFRASLVGSFAPDDLAVIRVSGPSGLVPAKFADSSNLQVGQIVLAIGNPLGLESSVTDGIVSAVGRTVSEGGGVTLPQTVQTSAAINPGNSGGALVNLNGKVVGIPTLAAVDPELGGSAAPGIGFAIPSNTVTRIAGQLVTQGTVTQSGRAALNVTVTTAYGPDGNPAGAAIVRVQPGGAAAKAGLQAGDVITKVASAATPDVSTLADVLAGLSPGQSVTVTYIDTNGIRRTTTVILGQLQGS